MKIIRKLSATVATGKMTIAFDVSKKSLTYYFEMPGNLRGDTTQEINGMRGEVPNGTSAITAELERLGSFAREHGYTGLHVVCEPTGSYSDCLMRTAHRLGCTTAWVSGERVHKAKVIENGDAGKDDIKDPRIVLLLSQMHKEQRYRILPPAYKYVRELNRMYEDADAYCVELKGLIHHLIKRLFCDFPMSKDFIYSCSGKRLLEKYGYSPYRITAETMQSFTRTMGLVSGIRFDTLARLHAAAKWSALHCQHPLEQAALEQRLQDAWHDWERYNERRAQLRQQIEHAYEKLRDTGDMMPLPDSRVFTKFHIARILGETGPLSDFSHWRVLLKYGGLNLRTRESGAYKGKLRLSKKGRIPLRGVLGRLTFSHVRRGKAFGAYYHARKAEKIPGAKIMAMVERKLLKIFYALGKTGTAFNELRLYQCESQYQMAA
jgi:transposase